MQPTWAPPPTGRPAPPVPVPVPPRAGEAAAPVAEDERQPVVDALRALALLGIVVVNVAAYRTGTAPSLAGGGGRVGGEVSPLTVGLSALTEGRFYPLFSFLFGWGFAVQEARSRVRGRSVVGPWLRRMGLLWLAGLAHGILLYDGDILATYGVIGVGLLLVRALDARWLAALGVFLLAGQALVAGGFSLLTALVVADEGEAVYRADHLRELLDIAAVYGDGSYLDVVAQRAEDFAYLYLWGFPSVGGTVAGMMVLGVAAARAGWVDPRRWPAGLRRAIVPLWLAGVALSVPAAWMLGEVSFGSDEPGVAFVARLAYALLGPAVALLFAGTVIRAYEGERWRRALDLVAPAGRLSLTLYLSQSLVASLLFNGYGLGLGEELGIGAAVAVMAGVWVLQIVLARLWLRFFTMGPLEAGARAVAYLRWPPIRRRPASPLATPGPAR